MHNSNDTVIENKSPLELYYSQSYGMSRRTRNHSGIWEIFLCILILGERDVVQTIIND